MKKSFKILLPPICAFLIVVILRLCFAIVLVENISMSPTLVQGDRILVIRFWPRKLFYCGQVVILWPWERSFKGGNLFGVIPYVKRVVGVSGDVVISHISNLHEIHKPDVLSYYNESGFRSWFIPEGHIFVRGDYEIGGIDSLTWGPVPVDSVLGVMVLKLPSLMTTLS